MTAVIKAQSPADILAMLPALAGFTPRESVVLLAFRGKRTCGAIRFDLPKSKSSTVQKRFANSMMGTLSKMRQVDAVIPIICTDDTFDADGRAPGTEFARVLGRRLQHAGFELRESLCHASDGWVSYLDDAAPAGGYPLSDIENSVVHDAMPADLRRGKSSLSDQPTRVPDADDGYKARVRQQFAHYRALLDEAGWEDGAAPAELDLLNDLPLLMENALSWDDHEIDQGDALLLLAWQGPPVRDMTMLQWASDELVGELCLRENDSMRQGDGGDAAAHQLLSDLMLGIGPRPDPERIERGIDLVGTVVSRADDSERPPLLCMLAWLSWALGHGTAAGKYIAEARRIRPEYGMAEVLDTILSNGMLPEWAFAEPVANE